MRRCAGNLRRRALSNGLNMAPTARLPPKKDVALALLEQASMYIHLDPRADTVKVPAWFKKQAQLVLQIGLNMPVPIPDLRLDDEGMSCTLSFNRAPFHCTVPWTSVFAMVGDDMRGMVWPDDMPPEVAQQSAAKAPGAAIEPALKQPPPKRTPLREVPPPPAATTKPKRSRKKAASDTNANANAKTTPKASRAPVAVVPRARPSAPVVTPLPSPAPRALPSPDAEDAAPRAPRAPQGPRSPSAKPKRELPPYLRVVK